MKSIRMIVGLGLATAAFLATSTLSFATVEMSKKEKKPCITCHESKMPKGEEGKKLNDTGKYYHKNKSMPAK